MNSREASSYTAREAATYDQDRESERHWHVEHAFVSALVRREAPRRLLDVPVGTGRFFPLYRDVADVRGVDLSPQMLEQARLATESVPGANISLCHGSVYELPFENDSFDLTLCCRLLHLIPPERIEAALTEMSRVTRGVLCVQFYLRGSVFARLIEKVAGVAKRIGSRIAGRSASTPWSHIPSYVHTRDSVDAAAAAAGLQLAAEQRLCAYRGNAVVMLEWRRRG